LTASAKLVSLETSETMTAHRVLASAWSFARLQVAEGDAVTASGKAATQAAPMPLAPPVIRARTVASRLAGLLGGRDD
jgi:hypothetical protein